MIRTSLDNSIRNPLPERMGIKDCVWIDFQGR